MTQSGTWSRRRVLTLLASGALATATVGAAQEGGDGGDEPVAAFRLGGRVPGWQGRQPQEIQGTENPTLSVQEGEVYELTWENLDGAPHNFAFRDDQGNNLPVILPEGATVTGTPTAGGQAGNQTATTMGNQTGNQTGNQSDGRAGTDIIRIIPGESSIEDPEIGGPRATPTEGNQTTGQTGNQTTLQAGNQTATPAGNATGAETGAGGVTTPEGAISVTETITGEGATQTFRFVVTPEITTYICPIHPTTMVGAVQVETEREETETPSGL